ncbi:hypothetical protein [Amycolatopsis nigrescens]|uniref:hypothetical protein n=1 Tax=Amycolatopsis nigrescens TaxID=381445 RepID=UPI00038267AF|nr:hypothetical protein [Amycolatopsis nigrescens]
MTGFTRWLRDFEAEAARRRAAGDPNWARGARLDPALVRSIQRFQLGEAGDGARLIASADRAGDQTYATAVRFFVAEEQNHARLLALLLNAAKTRTITAHWTDTVFVRLRRALGLTTELLVLMVAEVVALRYYRALRDGSGDALTSEVAARVLADEQRHVSFHCRRLRDSFAAMSRPGRSVVTVVWRLVLIGAVVTVAWGHGRALRRLGVARWRFVADVVNLFEEAVDEVRATAAPMAAPAR